VNQLNVTINITLIVDLNKFVLQAKQNVMNARMHIENVQLIIASNLINTVLLIQMLTIIINRYY
jgi:hypothetical protein